jgi:hypothetical protein
LAQSLNVDLGFAESVPASSYTAAGLAGVWNGYAADRDGRQPLLNLDGSAPGVTF